MKNIKVLFSTVQSLSEKPWLIIGKGPSYKLIDTLDTSQYNIFTLNHVIRQQKAKISHLMDIDVFESCADEINNQAEFLLMPYYPHSDNFPGKFSLPELIEKLPILKKIDQENRLYWYDHLGLKALRFKRLPVSIRRQIFVHSFSAEAALAVLALNKIKTIRTLGVDGGINYNSVFELSDAHTRLANGRTSFDDQFEYMSKIIMKNKIDFQAIGTNYPIKVYVATQEEQMLSVKVLEYSIKKHSSQPVEIYPMHKGGIQYREPKNPDNRQRTPFSFQRFLIPQFNNYLGRAIYLDSDMQVFSDINSLWTLPMGSCDILTVVPSRLERRRLQFSVMLLDCEKLQWNINKLIDSMDSGDLSYEDLMYDMAIANNIGVSIPKQWNCLEWFKPGQSCLVHYTDMNTQPWVSRNNVLGHLWVADLIEAIEQGSIDIALVDEHIKKGWIRPSLRYQIENKVLSSTNLPKSIRELDSSFNAPYKQLQETSSTPYKSLIDHVWGKTNKIIRALKQRL